MRQTPLILGLRPVFRRCGPSTGKVLEIDAAGHGVDIRMTMFLMFVQTMSAGEYYISALEKQLLASEKVGGRTLEERELVHAVIDGGARFQMIRKREHHRGVVPANKIADVAVA